jgi:8-oxo-dGDP phosphatase
VLVDSYASPGITSERIRIFLARGLRTAETDYQREGEEKFLRTAWVPLEEAVQAALAGKLHNGATIQGVLAAHIAHSRGFAGLRPADAPEV